MEKKDSGIPTMEELLKTLEKQHEEGLREARAFLNLQFEAQICESQRLSRKYGSAHPRVRQLEARLAYLRKMQGDQPVVEPVEPPIRAGKFVVFQGADEKYYFHLRAANGEIILQSEGYTTFRSAQNGVETVRKNAAPERFEERQTEGGDPYFVLKSGNHQVIGRSEVYSSSAAMRDGIQSVIKNASTAGVEKRET
ncbi:MAG: DUF1508 domain-containing protein [Phaeodactylibacter sp.]|nr:DUF1508 domain-containing protein [Phaeodactylibacter sp.]